MLTINSNANPRMKPIFIHWILRFLLEAPEFEFDTYKSRDGGLLRPPPAVNQLLRLWRAIQYVSPTDHIDESTYEESDELIATVPRCLGFGGSDEEKEVGLERIIVWVGDQLIVSRLREL